MKINFITKKFPDIKNLDDVMTVTDINFGIISNETPLSYAFDRNLKLKEDEWFYLIKNTSFFSSLKYLSFYLNFKDNDQKMYNQEIVDYIFNELEKRNISFFLRTLFSKIDKEHLKYNIQDNHIFNLFRNTLKNESFFSTFFSSKNDYLITLLTPSLISSYNKLTLTEQNRIEKFFFEDKYFNLFLSTKEKKEIKLVLNNNVKEPLIKNKI